MASFHAVSLKTGRAYNCHLFSTLDKTVGTLKIYNRQSPSNYDQIVYHDHLEIGKCECTGHFNFI